MVAPRGKGIYGRGPSLYPGGDVATYAKALECDFVVLINGRGVEDQARRAQQLGLDVLLWSPPDTWHPDNWRATLELQAERVQQLGLAGLVADIEDWPQWASHRDEIPIVGQALAQLARTFLSVGFTSFPSWGGMSELAAVAAPAGVWGSPQLYGVLEPGTPAELKARAARWRAAFPEVSVSLAAWSREPADQASYLAHFSDERGALLWQSTTARGSIYPLPGTELFEVLRTWNVNARPAEVEGPGAFLSVVMQSALRPFPFA